MRRAPRTPFMQSRLLVLPDLGRGHYLMSTVLGDRRTEQVRRPERVDECTSRQRRREVLWALGVAGRSGGSPGRRGTYKRNLMSGFHC